MFLEAIASAVAAGARLAAACKLVGLAVRTVERWRARPDSGDQRRGPRHRPPNALSAAEEAKVVDVMTSPRYGGMSPKQVVPRLADEGRYLASGSTLYRLQRRLGLRNGRREIARTHITRATTVHQAVAPNQVWSWDITWPPTAVRGRYLYLYLYAPAYPRLPFADLAAAVAWVRRFVAWYNGEHRHSGIRYVTPDERHFGVEKAVLARRHALYEQARRRKPGRWSRGTRNWDPVGIVVLNPEPALREAA